MDIATLRQKSTEWIGKYKFVILILLVGVGLMLIPTGTRKDEPVESVTEQVNQQQILTEELEEILTNIQGAGRVQVMLTMRAGEQIIYQTDTPTADRQDTVIVTGEDRAQDGLVQQIIAPTYRGAIILCQGADSASVCLAITDAVSKVTGLDSSQISVLKMK